MERRYNEKTYHFVMAEHKVSAKGWAIERGFNYMGVHNLDELTAAITTFTQQDPAAQPILMEVFTDKNEDVRLLKDYYRHLKDSYKN